MIRASPSYVSAFLLRSSSYGGQVAAYFGGQPTIFSINVLFWPSIKKWPANRSLGVGWWKSCDTPRTFDWKKFKEQLPIFAINKELDPITLPSTQP